MKTTYRQERVAASLYGSLTLIFRNLDQVELPEGFTRERFRTLTTVHLHEPISVTKVADLEELTPATVSRNIASLERAGLIARRKARYDGRSVLLSTTGKGRRMYQRGAERYVSYLREAMASLDPEQQKLITELVSVLERLSTALEG